MRRVMITGAGSGIGAALAQAMAAAGHEVVVADRDGRAAAEVAAHISQSGGRAHGLELDVTDTAQIDAANECIRGIDVLINNAGLQQVARLEAFPAERWELLVAVMLTGAANMMRAVLPGMRERGFGRIVNIGSIHSLIASPFKSAYTAAKHGLVGLSKSVALETADTDITVNTICPAYVRTPLVEKQIEAQSREHGLSPELVERQIMLAPMPKKAFVTPEEIAALAIFLMGSAARNITGQSIAIDGGWTAQ
ncbi:MAG: 3-hydroxybutyrate dehydrogenase [Proteobacteria bacterium]|nr:3-hydroxybutyrate dehydrogenase [Pseudomonadota bacterium]